MREPLSRRDLFRLPPPDESRAPDVIVPAGVVHIASLLLQVVPSKIGMVRDAVGAMPSAELHPTVHPGKVAVVFEANDERALADATQALSHVPGVLTVSIVAHLIEDAASLDAEYQP